MRTTLLGLMGLLAAACVPSSSPMTTAAPQPVQLARFQGEFVSASAGDMERIEDQS